MLLWGVPVSRVWCASLLAYSALACSDATTFVVWPEFSEGTRSVVVGLTRADRFEVSVYDRLEASAPPALIFAEPSELGVEVLELSQSLSELRLGRGEVPAWVAGFEVDALDLVGLSTGRWSLNEAGEGGLELVPVEAPALSAALRAFRAQATPPACPSPVRATTFTLPEAARTWLALPTAEGQGLVGGDHGKLVFFGGQEARPLSFVETSTAGALQGRFAAGGQLPDGDLWIAGELDVELVRLEGDALRVLRRLPRPTSDQYIFDGWARSEEDLYVLGSTGKWLHFRDGAWTLLHDWEWEFARSNAPSGAVFEAPFMNAVCAVFIGDTTVVCHADGVLEYLRVPTEEGSGISVGGLVPGVGLVVGSTGGEFFRLDEAGFTPLAEGLRIRTRGFAPLDEGFLVGGDAGYLGYFDPARGMCEVSSGLGVVPDRITPFSDTRYVITGSAPGPSTLDGTFLVLEWPEL